MKIVRCKGMVSVIVSLFVASVLIGFAIQSIAAEKKAVTSLTITTGGVGGGWYPIGGGIAHLVNPKILKYGYRAGAVPGGGVANPPRVGMGEADIGLSYATNLSCAVKGIYPYKKAYPKLRAIANIYDMGFQFVVAERTGIDSIRQIVQKKMALNFAPGKVGTGTEWMFKLIMDEYGAPVEKLKEWGWKLDYGGQAHQLSQYRDKHVDGFCMHTQVPNSATMEAIMSRKSRFLPIPDDIAEVMGKKWGTKRVIIPTGTYERQNYEVATITMPCVLFTTMDVPEEVIYEITKAMYENAKYLSGVHVSFKGFSPERGSKGVGIDFHPGAKKYYQEVGVLK